jgi:hypothetical protein
MNSDSAAIDLRQPTSEWTEVQRWLAGSRAREQSNAAATSEKRVSSSLELRRELQLGNRVESMVFIPLILAAVAAIGANLVSAGTLMTSWNGVVNLVFRLVK